MIDRWLRVAGAKDVLALGDCTFVPDGPLPATAQVCLFDSLFSFSLAGLTPICFKLNHAHWRIQLKFSRFQPFPPPSSHLSFLLLYSAIPLPLFFPHSSPQYLLSRSRSGKTQLIPGVISEHSLLHHAGPFRAGGTSTDSFTPYSSSTHAGRFAAGGIPRTYAE